MRKTIDIATMYGPKRVKPIARLGVCAIHRTWCGPGYTLTHVPSGYAIVRTDRLRDARRAMRLVPSDWWADAEPARVGAMGITSMPEAWKWLDRVRAVAP